MALGTGMIILIINFIEFLDDPIWQMEFIYVERENHIFGQGTPILSERWRKNAGSYTH